MQQVNSNTEQDFTWYLALTKSRWKLKKQLQ